MTTEAKTETEVVPPVTTEAKTETEVVPPVTTESSMTTESSTREKTEKSTTVKPADKTQIVTPKFNHISVDRTTDATTTSGERQPVEKTTQKPVVKEQKATLPATGEKVTSVLTVLGMGILATVIFLGLKRQEK
ncbi:LPXTG cell wall anchor domain-containing protein [Streptococcus sp. S784/96/1]|uniref:LPXTG cell wall anchor domain-containing protein n=1 Tax=Streptococcus sp. S784/96/1 TaxID=2653499 RepID=UPI0013873F67|nr:LPXTG cell wall anchor domain-containing protein [Streptococcus sp. S784/96/1]